ncbi:MAG TPA: GSCFA domain-containing protein [Candidatus Udaeobacter sp.]|nr:GSCFA domain-containing protein [Candidatus Udaeobacter sp.]
MDKTSCSIPATHAVKPLPPVLSSASSFPVPKSIYVATAAEADKNWQQNRASRWYKKGVDPNDLTGDYAFQRLRKTWLPRTWFTPHIDPKFKLRSQDKFFAIGSCFARALEQALVERGLVIESAAPEFVRLQPVNEDVTGLGFTNKYNTFSMLNELRWALDPTATFPVESIVQITKDIWFDPHITPTLESVGFEETLDRRALMQTVTKRIANCRAVIITLGLAEVWRDIKANVYINRTPLFKTHPDRYEFHLTGFAENWTNLEAIHALLSRYGHPDHRIVITVSPVPLMATFSTMDVVVANTYAKSLLRSVAQQWAAAHGNVDYFPSYEIVVNSDRSTVWESDLRHVTYGATEHIMELFLRSYLA